MRLIRVLVLTWLSVLVAMAHGATPSEPQPALTVRGQLALPAAGERPAVGEFVIELRDTRTDRVLTEQRLPLDATHSVQSFQLRLPHDRLRRGHRLGLRGSLLSRDGAQWLTPPIAIDAAVASVELGTLQLTRAPRPLAFQTHIDCRIREFVVGMAGDALTLRDGEDLFALQSFAADPDQRFEAVGDPSTYVHTAGTSATVAVRGVIYAGCSLLR